MSAITSFYYIPICGSNCILRLTHSLIRKLHSSPGDIVKKTAGGPNEYHMEKSFARASLADSSQCGRFLQQAVIE
jgi:hypothetical protein